MPERSSKTATQRHAAVACPALIRLVSQAPDVISKIATQKVPDPPKEQTPVCLSWRLGGLVACCCYD
jgi:hypothetical protein